MKDLSTKIIVGNSEELFTVKENKESLCKFEVYLNGVLVLSFESEGPFMRPCTNPGKIDDKIIYKIIAELKSNIKQDRL
ncbi:hypothetical protein [Mucilaginibacter sp. FT3.2]|uniref:hypothetical protein n=1 Tax=Mucilaginibacter sp. FT3.2 TaxID=2723090 RepID=UPI00160F60E9|nr:hypothetical protein [Mucilaginibacter sp. FT3.2]MBB6235118.1 hypothetical protein [Mucilaginibacter sp. FT3.2]